MRRLPLLPFIGLLLCQFCAHTADKTKNEDAVGGKDLANWIAQLDNEDSLQRMLAINALADIGPKAEPAVHKLLDLAVKDCKGYVNQNARRALTTIGDAAFTAIIGKLETITEHERPDLYAAMLREFGKAFSSKLSAHLKDENAIVVRACINALADIEGKETVLKPLAPQSAEFVALMKTLLEHKDKSVREAAKTVIEEIEKPSWKCCGPIYR